MGRGIAVFGGNFDPVHIGHLQSALDVRERLGLEEVRLMAAACPPHRPAPEASPADRHAMLALAVAGVAGLVADRHELDRFALNGSYSFTVDTLSSIRSELGREEPLILVLGTDAFARLPTWHDWLQLFELAHLLVLRRPGSHQSDWPASLEQAIQGRKASLRKLQLDAQGHVACLPVTQLAVSSTEIRRRLAQGLPVDYLVPQAVLVYLQERQLYQPGGT